TRSKRDWSSDVCSSDLLLTFLFFFIFSANIGSIAAVHDYLVETLSGQEFAVSVLLSQVISNVPTAVLLAPFTADGPALLLGTNRSEERRVGKECRYR